MNDLDISTVTNMLQIIATALAITITTLVGILIVLDSAVPEPSFVHARVDGAGHLIVHALYLAFHRFGSSVAEQIASPPSPLRCQDGTASIARLLFRRATCRRPAVQSIACVRPCAVACTAKPVFRVIVISLSPSQSRQLARGPDDIHSKPGTFL